MKKTRKKLTAYALVAVLGLSFTAYPVHAEEEHPMTETPQQTQDIVESGEETLSDVSGSTDTSESTVETQAEEKSLQRATNNAGDFNVTGDYEKGWTYDSSTNTLTFNHSGDYTIEGNGQETEEQIHVAHGFWGTIIIKNVNAKTMTVENTATLTLMLDGTNTLREGLVFADATTGSLTIDSQTDGSLTATGYGAYGVGIGGGNGQAGNNITINGGTVTATGTDAGIGGGYRGAGSNITINGGTVTATGSWGAGIGGGSGRAGNNITITGGTVTASSTYGAGIGGGYNGSASNITIDGGSVKASRIGAVPTNNNGNPVYLAKLENQSGVNEVTVDDKSFTRQGDHPDDGAFYLYLTGQDHTITSAVGAYNAFWNGQNGFVIKQNSPIPAVTVDKTTASSITVKVLENQDIYGTAEYSLDNQSWQSSNEFTGLNADTEYTVYARYQGNDMYVRSEAGTATVTTMKDGNTLFEEKIPVNLKGIYEQKLSDVTIADGWTWVDKDTALSVGSQSYPARFDTTAYENEYDFTGVNGYDGANHYVEVNLTVSVSKANSTVTINTSSLDKKYDGTPVNNPDVEKTGSTKDVTFTWYKKDSNDWKELSSAPADAGNYKVVASVEADDNYNGASAELEFAISQTANEWTDELSIKGWTYGDKAYVPTAKSKYGTVTFTYSDTKDGTYTDTVPTNAGTWYVKATVAGNENYTGLEVIAEFTIEKANTLLKFSSDNMDKKYDGKPVNNPDVEKTGSTKDVTFTWYQKDGDGWKELSSSPTNAGSYKVVASVEADNNYNGASVELEFIVNKAIPQFEVPTDLKVEQGQALSTVKLPDGFAWKDATQTANTLGKQTFKAIYTPKDTENYQTVETEITVNVVAKNVPADDTDKTQQTGVETGDSTNVFVWSVLLMISLAGAVSSVLFRRRNQR